MSSHVRYRGSTRLVSFLPSPPNAKRRARSCSPGISCREFLCAETTGSPTFLGDHHCAFALLFDPGGGDAPGHYGTTLLSSRLTKPKTPALPTFEAQSHGFSTRCLRLAVPVTRSPPKTRFRLLARLYRTGLITRMVPTKGFRFTSCSSSSFPKPRSARSDRD